jgi:5,10-methylenetetrahydrofolate reductase
VKTITLHNLKRDFENLKMKDNESVDTFMTQVMSDVNQLRQYGDDIENKRVIEKVLRNLPKKFEPIVVPIEEFKDLSLMQIDELIGSLVAYESRISRYEEGSLEHAFKSELHVTIGIGRGMSYNYGRRGQFSG